MPNNQDHPMLVNSQYAVYECMQVLIMYIQQSFHSIQVTSLTSSDSTIARGTVEEYNNESNENRKGEMIARSLANRKVYEKRE